MIPVHEFLIRLTVAAVLGGLIGFERERADSDAGLRTHAIVALGAALFMLVSMYGFASAVHPPAVVLDPSRVAAQIVTGIGFLGAGVIVFRKDVIRGLTTAATVWLVAAMGMAVAGGLYIAAIAATVLALIILAAVRMLERKR
jgi:putative Mg2+ transporter-C (MgtC) family protein